MCKGFAKVTWIVDGRAGFKCRGLCLWILPAFSNTVIPLLERGQCEFVMKLTKFSILRNLKWIYVPGIFPKMTHFRSIYPRNYAN
jgi:hypothetical protein